MAETVNVYEAKTHLSRLITRVEAGETITLSRNGRPVARIVPLSTGSPNRVSGAWKTLVTISPDFDDFSDEDARDWYGA